MEDPTARATNGETPANSADQNGISANGANGSTLNGRVKRKQWVLHDGPHGSLQRLRLRMAEEGCGHSQVALAKQFLAENSGESDQLAIHWLMKAADQGHYEGLELLKTCFETNRGITESNCHKIRSFLDMSQHERAARLGAKTLFASMSQGSDFVTTKQLEQWLEESFAQQPQSSVEGQRQEVDTLVLGGELLSEQHLMSAASVYATGHFPPLLRLLTLGSKQKLSYLCHWLTHSILNLFTHPLSLSLMFSLVVVFTALNNPFQVLLNMQLSSVVILLSWVLTLAAAVIFTAQSCRLVREWNIFYGWSSLLSQHAQHLLEPAVPENLYIARTFPNHFARFLLATVPCISLQPVLQLVRSSLPQPGLWIPFGELSVLATLLCSACLDCRFGLGLDDLFCLVGWIVWRAETIPWNLWSPYADEEHVSEDRFQLFHPALSVRFDLMAIIGLLILVPFYARRLRRFTHFSHLLAWCLPHFSSLVWLFLAVDWLQLSSYDGILRGLVLSLAAVLLRSNCNWLTKANLLLCCITSYSSGSALGLTPWVSFGLAVALIAAVRMGAQFLTLSSQDHRLSELLRSLLIRRQLLYVWTIVRSALMVACVAILTIRVMEYFESHDLLTENAVGLPPTSSTPSPRTGGRVVDEFDPELDELTWDRYQDLCSHPTSGVTSSLADTQLACSSLNGLEIDWEGVVRQVSIDSRHNWMETALSWLPSPWVEWVRCRVGERWSDCHENEHGPSQSFESKRCIALLRINQKRGRLCHVERFSTFTFRFEVEPETTTTILPFFDRKSSIELIAGPHFQSYGLRLTPGQQIRFKGHFSMPTMNGMKPEVELSLLECLSCQPESIFPGHAESASVERSTALPDMGTLAASALQGAANFVLPHFIRLNVTQLLWSH